MNDLYPMIFKRKSFRRFNKNLFISKSEMQLIENKIANSTPLLSDIKVQTKIVKREETTCRRGEYCLIIYSEEKTNYLLNVGYMIEQIDLYLASINVGACWYGMGKAIAPPENSNLKYVIMLSFGKSIDSEFRKDYTKARRKDTSKIWQGEDSIGIANIVKYAPSACNSQPWRVYVNDNKIKINRSTNVKSIMPKAKIPFSCIS